jgi:hypothetical protein
MFRLTKNRRAILSLSRGLLHKALCCSAVLLALIFPLQTVDALPTSLNPTEAATLAEEVQCYGIPYGGIGCASHGLTYYTLCALYLGRKPLAPWLNIMHKTWDCIIGVISLLVTVSLAIVTLVRCKYRLELVFIAIWKICLCVTLGCSAITSSLIEARKNRKSSKSFEFSWSTAWLILYVAGTIVGLVGVIILVREAWADIADVRIISYVFVAVFGCIMIIIFFVSFEKVTVTGGGKRWGWFMFPPAAAFSIVVFTAVFYSDLILGAVSGNLAGVPNSEASVIYWLYFVFKRVPLFTI